MKIEKVNNPNNLRQSKNTRIRKKKEGFLNPVLVTFQNGDLNNEKASGFRIKFVLDNFGKTNVEVISSCGQVYKDVQNKKLGPKQFIAIHNKGTKKVKLIEVDSALLINSALIKTPQIKTVNADYGKEVRALSKAFGIKKMVSKIEQREKLNMDSTLFQQEIKETVSSINLEHFADENISSEVGESQSIIELLPSCNRNAQSRDEIYKLSDIFNENEMEDLQEEIKKILNENLNFNKYSKVFQFCFENTKNPEDNLDSLGGLLFAEVLIKFFKIPSNRLNAKNISFCSFSTVIHSKIVNEFCVKSGTSLCRPLSIKDKGLCYIIVLTLLCCNYQIDLQLIATTTSVHLNKLTRLARVVGAVPLSTDSNIYILKTPLPPLPKISNIRKRRK